MFGTTKTLIVVYKDEMLLNQLKKMVETNDDESEENIVGTTDGSINIVSWDEKVWLSQKKAGNINGKILFLGDIKGADSLIPVIDVKFDKFGIRFGWAGKQAILCARVQELVEKDLYSEFVDELATYPVPEMIKTPIWQKSNVGKTKPSTGIKKILKIGRDITISPLAAVEGKVVDKTKKSLAEKQMLFFGVVNLYNNGLEEFMNM